MALSLAEVSYRGRMEAESQFNVDIFIWNQKKNLLPQPPVMTKHLLLKQLWLVLFEQLKGYSTQKWWEYELNYEF